MVRRVKSSETPWAGEPQLPVKLPGMCDHFAYPGVNCKDCETQLRVLKEAEAALLARQEEGRRAYQEEEAKKATVKRKELAAEAEHISWATDEMDAVLKHLRATADDFRKNSRHHEFEGCDMEQVKIFYSFVAEEFAKTVEKFKE